MNYKYWKVLPSGSVWDWQKFWNKIRRLPAVSVCPADWYDPDEDDIWDKVMENGKTEGVEKS